MSTKKMNTYAVEITAYVDAGTELEAVKKAIHLTNTLHILTTHRAINSDIFELLDGTKLRRINIADNLHQLIANNEL